MSAFRQAELLEAQTISALDNHIVFCPLCPLADLQARPLNCQALQAAYTLGIALGLHFLWVGHFPVTLSYVYLLAIMFKNNLTCLRWEFLTAHAPQFINIVDIWRQELQLQALYQRHLLLSALTTYFGQTVCPTGFVSHIIFLFHFNYRMLHTWKNYQMLWMSGIFLNCQCLVANHHSDTLKYPAFARVLHSPAVTLTCSM